jgi:hypothetical protein
MNIFLDPSFLAIFNLFVLLLWPVFGTYTGPRRNVLDVIVLILAVIAVVADIVFIVLRLVH